MRDLLHTCAVKLCVIWKNWPKMCGNHEKLSGNPGYQSEFQNGGKLCISIVVSDFLGLP